jgi:hypothetical protein
MFPKHDLLRLPFFLCLSKEKKDGAQPLFAGAAD